MEIQNFIKDNAPLKKYNTFNLDVKCSKFVEVSSSEDIDKIIGNIDRNKSILILGGGSNILLLNDFSGLVIRIISKGIKIVNETKSTVDLLCAAGEIWDDVVTFCIENQFYGIENLALIPGTIGAAPIQNIGAYGVELKDVLVSVAGIELNSKEKLILSNTECEFDYRSSIFKTKLKGKFLITAVILRLNKDKKFQFSYRALSEKFGKLETNEIDIKEVADFIKKTRMEKLPDHTLYGNAGSFFKNPEINQMKFEELRNKFKNIVWFSTSEGKYKLAAGWLIEECGLKGKRIGNVSCYEKQALVIINHGKATGKEIKEFSETVQKAVLDKFGIQLRPEVNFIE